MILLGLTRPESFWQLLEREMQRMDDETAHAESDEPVPARDAPAPVLAFGGDW